MVKKWDSVRDTLPNVVDRLVSLKELHEQGTNSKQTTEQVIVMNKSQTI